MCPFVHAVEDAYVKFAVGQDRRISKVTMWAVSPLADFSFDYHDLEFAPEAAAAK